MPIKSIAAAPASAQSRGQRLAAIAAYAACLTLSLCIFFKQQVASGFQTLFSDRTDSVIEISILEHWYNVLRGLASWPTMFYFYPYEATLAFNDAYFLYGMPYALFRLIGTDPFLSAQLVSVLLRIVAFAAFHLFLRRCLGLGRWWSLLGAVLFTLSATMAMRAHHAQLLSVAFAPLFAWLVWNAVRAFAANAYRPFLLWGSLAAVLMAAWLMTTYYMAWFTLFFLSCSVLIAALARPRAALALVWRVSKRGWTCLAVVASVFAIGVSPFLMLYLPKARATGMHPFSAVLEYTVHPLDLIHVGNSTLLLSRLDGLLNGYFRPGLAPYDEHVSGITLFLFLLFVTACASLWSHRWRPRNPAIWLLATTAVATWLLTLRIGHWSPWIFVFDFVPGAQGLRVVTRYQLFLAAPVIAVAVAYLATLSARAPAALRAIVVVLLVGEQITLAQPIDLQRKPEVAQLRSIPAPPPECRSFFIARGRPGTDETDAMNAIYSHNVDAMLLAEWFHLPTINGFSTFVPPDWNFAGPDRPDYRQRVEAYARNHKLADMCALDVIAKRWDLTPFGPQSE